MEDLNYHKYARQMRLPNFGLVEQKKLFEAKVLVVGAGGLGCPALIYLASAGVGQIGIVDFDVVEESNLHRQILYTSNDIGKLKAEQAAKKVKEINAQCLVQTYPHEMQTNNVDSILTEYDLVIDGTDNFATRYLLNDACVRHSKALVYGSISRYEGQVSVFNLKMNEGYSKNYRDLFPNEPSGMHIQNCEEAGVIGVLAGVIGCLQANEAIKIICGIGKPLANKMLSYHSLYNTFYESDYSSVGAEKSLDLAPTISNKKTESKNSSESIFKNNFGLNRASVEKDFDINTIEKIDSLPGKDNEVNIPLSDTNKNQSNDELIDEENKLHKEAQSSLENLRFALNSLDTSMIEMLAKRKEIVTKIAEVKKTLNMALVQTEQWELTLRKRLVEASKFGLDKDFITEVFNKIHGESIAIQNRFYDNI
jgi:molybdopterin/thiamine biosynthesis adenylyltransferase/chorismate mutase